MRIGSCASAAAATPRGRSRKRAKRGPMPFIFCLPPPGGAVDVEVRPGVADLRVLAVVEQGDGARAGALADEPRRVRFGDDRLLVGAVPRPVNFVRRHALEVALLALIALLLDEEPYLAFEDVVDLLGFVHVRSRMIARRARRDHQAALVAVALERDHRAFALAAAARRRALGDVLLFCVKRHRLSPFWGMDNTGGVSES